MAFAFTSDCGQQRINNSRGNLPLPFPASVNAPLAPENNKPRLEMTTVQLGNDVSEAGGVRSSFLPRATVSHFCLLFAIRWTGSASPTTSTDITCFPCKHAWTFDLWNADISCGCYAANIRGHFFLIFTCKNCEMYVFRAYFTCEIHVMYANVFDLVKIHFLRLKTAFIFI